MFRSEVIHLVPRETQVADLALDTKVFGVDRVGLQCRLGGEFAVQHDVACVVHAACVDSDLQMEKTRYLPAEAMEALSELVRVLPALLRRFTAQFPHDDVFDHIAFHDAHSAGGKPAF